MKQFTDRLKNATGNYLHNKDGHFEQIYYDICEISKDMDAHVPMTHLTKAEFDDMKTLTDIVIRNTTWNDGQDNDIAEAVQKVQKIILNRVGSRSWFQYKQNNPE